MKGLALDSAFFERMDAAIASQREFDSLVAPIVERARETWRTNRERYYGLLAEMDAAYDAGEDETGRLIRRAMTVFS